MIQQTQHTGSSDVDHLPFRALAGTRNTAAALCFATRSTDPLSGQKHPLSISHLNIQQGPSLHRALLLCSEPESLSPPRLILELDGSKPVRLLRFLPNTLQYKAGRVVIAVRRCGL